jgi:hypothetical protein
MGGAGKVWGTMIGVVFLGVISNGMTLLNFDDYAKFEVQGALILTAVLINMAPSRSAASARRTDDASPPGSAATPSAAAAGAARRPASTP